MKTIISLLLNFFLFVTLLSCSSEPSAQEERLSATADPEPYLYKPPTIPPTGLATQKLKKEALAEAFVSRLSTKAPAGVVVMQHEKLVLEEYYSLDSSAYVCVDALFPAYAGAMMGSTALHKHRVPFKPIPLHELYESIEPSASIFIQKDWSAADPEYKEGVIQRMDAIIQQQSGTTQGMAAEEFLFEPLQIDDYTWTNGALCLHPHAILQLGSLWVRRGRWVDATVLPDELVKQVLAPAYDAKAGVQKRAYGWQYFRLMAKGRKQPVLYWKGEGAQLFLLPEIEAVILIQGDEAMMQDAWEWLQQYLIPSLN